MIETLRHPRETPEGIPIPVFAPYVPERRRANGWSSFAQRAFIAELARIGCARSAAQAIGRSVRSAYTLRNKPGAESFAAAWEEALARGRQQARDTAISRALHGEVVPKFRNGRFMGYRMKHNDRLLLAALGSGKTHAAPFSALHHRLEEWEHALRRGEMNRADGTAARTKDYAEALEAHRIWEQEIKAEKRRKYRAEVRAKLRRDRAQATGANLRIRVL